MSLMCGGPAKSTPVKVNGGTSLTRDSVSAGGCGGLYGGPSTLRQMTHP